MKLPILLSVPHAGLSVPPEARAYCRLTHDEIVADGDEGAAEIYALQDDVAQFATSDVARAIVDLNRAEDDFRPDGVIKTHTCWNVPVYDPFPAQPVITELLSKYYRPYHQRLSVPDAAVKLSIDCHTMAAIGPPIGPGAGLPRPAVCLGDVDGKTIPAVWMRALARHFEDAFELEVTINDPFSGGFITRHHGQHGPWVQLELSRGPFMSSQEKKARVLQALTAFCQEMF